jgi:hypothetical protein
MTPEQRKQQIMDIQNELKIWASQNNIDPNLLRSGWGKHWGDSSPTPSASPNP